MKEDSFFVSVFGSISLEAAWREIGVWPKFTMQDAINLNQFDSGFLSSSEFRMSLAFVLGALMSNPQLFANSHFAMGVLGLPESDLENGRSTTDSKLPHSLADFDMADFKKVGADIEYLLQISNAEVQFCRPEMESLKRIL